MLNYEKFEDEIKSVEDDWLEIPKSHDSRKKTTKVDLFTSDEQFKAGYNPAVLKKQSTLVLKTSFHVINLILMSMCQVFLNAS